MSHRHPNFPSQTEGWVPVLHLFLLPSCPSHTWYHCSSAWLKTSTPLTPLPYIQIKALSSPSVHLRKASEIRHFFSSLFPMPWSKPPSIFCLNYCNSLLTGLTGSIFAPLKFILSEVNYSLLTVLSVPWGRKKSPEWSSHTFITVSKLDCSLQKSLHDRALQPQFMSQSWFRLAGSNHNQLSVFRTFSPHGLCTYCFHCLFPPICLLLFSAFMSQLKYDLLRLLWMSPLEQPLPTPPPHHLPYCLQSPHPHRQRSYLLVFIISLLPPPHVEFTLLKRRAPVHLVDATGATQFVDTAQCPSREQAFSTRLLD